MQLQVITQDKQNLCEREGECYKIPQSDFQISKDRKIPTDCRDFDINKSDVAGKINLNIPVKISTGRAISTVKPIYRTSYALVRYIAARPFAKTVSSNIDTQSNESFMQTLIERIKEFFYS